MLKSQRRPANPTAGHPRRPLGIRRSSSVSERRADASAHALVGRTPDRVHDARASALEGRRLPGAVQTLIESERGHATGARAVPEGLRAALGPGVDRARLHTGKAAAIAAQAVGAQAFAVGRDVFFARDRYRPDTLAGRALLAHELTHVVESPNSNEIARTPGTAYSDERKAAEAAFSYLLEIHAGELDEEWGGYIYRKNKSGKFYHSVPRTDHDPHSVMPNTERYAIAAAEDARIAHARNPGSNPAPAPFKPTPGWIEASDIQEQGDQLTATYHIHPSVPNKAKGFSDESDGASAFMPYAAKRSGDVPAALREGLNSYMIDLDEPDSSKPTGYPLHAYIVAEQDQTARRGLDSIVGIDPNLGNEWKCQFGFGRDGNVDEDGSACKGVAPSKDAMEAAAKIVESRTFAVGVQMGDISQKECLRMLKAADMSDDVAICGIDPRTPEQKRADELQRMMQIFERLQQTGQPTAHDWLSP